ncbi:MAG: DUF420 domain-containing protein [Planctomycetes bacterium]|nr:DUF420 domain-containing protein [Planctomycetota bacterium]
MSYEDLPTLNAALNGAAGAVTLAGWLFIKRGRRVGVHRTLMLAGIVVSAGFLASYLAYHFGPVEEKRFQGEGLSRALYLAMLASHIVLATLLVPLVFVTAFFGLSGRFEKHVRIARWTFPIWMYVSLTGVLVYVVLYL